ncbi:MAG: hypothetical protein AAFV93_18030 [Chloroflexota bacterium]
MTEQIAHLQRHEMQQKVKEQVLQDFIAYCDTLQGALDNPTPQVKQEVLRLLIKGIVVGKDMITIKHIVPIDDFSRLLPRDLRDKSPKVSWKRWARSA